MLNIQDDLLDLLSFHNTSAPHALRPSRHPNSSLPIIYMITPTYTRPTQKADLTRLCYALMHVPRLHWVVVEDSEVRTRLVERLLSGENSCKLPLTTHLNIRTSEELQLGAWDPLWRKCRGAEQMNHGIAWLAKSREKGLLDSVDKPNGLRGVVYFGDDDNTYDLDVFNEVH